MENHQDTGSMAVRRIAVPTFDDSSRCLSVHQKFALSRGVMAPSSVTSILDSDFDLVFLRSKQVPIVNLRASKLSPLDLKARGVTSAVGLRELGFDALDLTKPDFCSGAVAAFGADAVKHAFLLDPSDAVALAGSVALVQLDVSTSRLLTACAGHPEAARAVLQQSTRGAALDGVEVGALMDAGLRAPALVQLGYFVETIAEQTGASPKDLEKLGFS